MCSQEQQEETLGGPDSHETGQGPHGHLFGQWDGERTRLEELGIRFDFQYVSDSLWNIESEKPQRFASWNRFRWTMDIDFGKLISVDHLYFHATALWQGGGNLGTYLGTLTSPSGMSSMNTCRLDSWCQMTQRRWMRQGVRPFVQACICRKSRGCRNSIFDSRPFIQILQLRTRNAPAEIMFIGIFSITTCTPTTKI